MTIAVPDDDFLTGFIFGRWLSFIPRPVVQRVLALLTKRLHAAYPRLRERLSDAEGVTFLFILADMPFNVLLHIQDGCMHPDVLSKESAVTGDVTIRSASRKLIALLEGLEDGDALFFSRHLEVEGDMEALLILRNGLDNEQVDLRAAICSVFGPLSSLALRVAGPVERLGARFIRDIHALARAAMLPLARRQQELSETLERMERRLNNLESVFAKKSARNSPHG